MRDGFVIFQNQKPRDNEEICSSIAHYCIEHEFEFEFKRKKGTVLLEKEGEFYEVELKQLRERQRPACWMIGCWQKTAVS